MKKILMTMTAILTLGSTAHASDVDALTKAVVKIIQTQYSISKRVTTLEKKKVSTPKSTNNDSKVIKQMQSEIKSLNNKIAKLQKTKVKKKAVVSKKRTSKEDQIISDFLK